MRLHSQSQWFVANGIRFLEGRNQSGLLDQANGYCGLSAVKACKKCHEIERKLSLSNARTNHSIRFESDGARDPLIDVDCLKLMEKEWTPRSNRVACSVFIARPERLLLQFGRPIIYHE